MSHRPSSEVHVRKTCRCGCKSRVRLHVEGLADGRRQRTANAPSDEPCGFNSRLFRQAISDCRVRCCSICNRVPFGRICNSERGDIPYASRVASSNEEDARLASGKSGGGARSIHHVHRPGPVVYRLGRLFLTQAERVQPPPGPPMALWRSSERSGLISRVPKVQVLPAPLFKHAPQVLPVARRTRKAGGPARIRRGAPQKVKS